MPATELGLDSLCFSTAILIIKKISTALLLSKKFDSTPFYCVNHYRRRVNYHLRFPRIGGVLSRSLFFSSPPHPACRQHHSVVAFCKRKVAIHASLRRQRARDNTGPCSHQRVFCFNFSTRVVHACGRWLMWFLHVCHAISSSFSVQEYRIVSSLRFLLFIHLLHFRSGNLFISSPIIILLIILLHILE